MAPLEPDGPGIKPHHFSGVEEPNGIAVPDQPARASAKVTLRLLPSYQQALDTVLHNAAVQPEPPHRPGPPQVADVVTLTWYEDGALGTPSPTAGIPASSPSPTASNTAGRTLRWRSPASAAARPASTPLRPTTRMPPARRWPV
ncbi:hypothetical protein [Streptomyces sp. NPDC058991]|uniref:hypothetical protein n=1 Tax=unclassified Streptomyces TaxID=2593676 RepID=UPI003676DF17